MNARNELIQTIVLTTWPIGIAALGFYFIFFRGLGPYGALGLLLCFIGACFIIYSKLKLKRRTKKVIEWGTSGMSKREQSCYFLGCALLAFGIGLIFRF